MTAFIQRLLAQNNDAGLPGTVQPRPLARFEGSDGVVWIEETAEQIAPEVKNRPIAQTTVSPHLPIEAARQSEIEPTAQRRVQGIETIPDEPRASTPLRSIDAIPPVEPLSVIEQDPDPEIVAFTPQIDGEPAVIQLTRVERVTPELAPFHAQAPLIERADGLQTAIMPAPEPEAPRQLPERAPVIRVSIGRVEVHAAAPPAPTRPATPRRASASPKAVRSLDDYLRGRNEGRR